MIEYCNFFIKVETILGFFELEIKLKDFSAAHRVTKNYVGPCSSLHGHNYNVVIILSSKELTQVDFVVDFSEIKKIMNSWLKKNLDHSVIVSSYDTSLYKFVKEDKQKYYLISEHENTSAEILARHLFFMFKEMITKYSNVSLKKIQVYESLTSSSSYCQD